MVSTEASPHSRPQVVCSGGGVAWTNTHREGQDPILGSFTPGGMAFFNRAMIAPHCADLAQGAAPQRGENLRVLHRGNGWPVSVLFGLAARVSRNVGNENPLARPARRGLPDLGEGIAQSRAAPLAHPCPYVGPGVSDDDDVGGLAVLTGHPGTAEPKPGDVVSLKRVPTTHPYDADGESPAGPPLRPRPSVVGGAVAPLGDVSHHGPAHPLSYPAAAGHFEASGRSAACRPLAVGAGVVVRNANGSGP